MSYRFNFLAVLALALFCVPHMVRGAESYDNCTGFIDSVPTVITTQGTWCLRGDLSTSMSQGNAVTVATNNVTIDCNDYKIGGLSAGAATRAIGVYAEDRLNVTVRKCNIRGFVVGAALMSFNGGGNYTIEHNRIDGSTAVGIRVAGDGSVVRHNLVLDTGGTTIYAPEAHAIHAFGVVDVLDNTIAGVTGDVGVYGIYAVANSSGSISDNRIRGVVQTGVGEAAGISSYNTGRTILRNNDISGNGTAGIRCQDEKARARGNVINGFDIGIGSCGDAGGNDVTLR